MREYSNMMRATKLMLIYTWSHLDASERLLEHSLQSRPIRGRQMLMSRLLDSQLLSLCSPLFEAREHAARCFLVCCVWSFCLCCLFSLLEALTFKVFKFQGMTVKLLWLFVVDSLYHFISFYNMYMWQGVTISQELVGFNNISYKTISAIKALVMFIFPLSWLAKTHFTNRWFAFVNCVTDIKIWWIQTHSLDRIRFGILWEACFILHTWKRSGFGSINTWRLGILLYKWPLSL